MTGAWAVVALVVDTRWVVGCGVVSLGVRVVFSRAVKSGSTLAGNTASPSLSPSTAVRVEVEAVMGPMSVGSGAVGMTVRSPRSVQVDVVRWDKRMSCRAPAGPEAVFVGMGGPPNLRPATLRLRGRLRGNPKPPFPG